MLDVLWFAVASLVGFSGLAVLCLCWLAGACKRAEAECDTLRERCERAEAASIERSNACIMFAPGGSAYDSARRQVAERSGSLASLFSFQDRQA